MKIEMEISDKRIADLLVTGLEGGYMAPLCITKIYPGHGDGDPWSGDYTPDYIRAPFSKGGGVGFEDEEEPGEEMVLTREKMEKGLQIMSEKYPQHFSDFIRENEDAITGDVFLQCALLGDIVYG